MAQVNDLGAFTLQYPSHDVDGSIVAIEQAGCSDYAYLILREIHVLTNVSAKVRNSG
jgi:hypothetical protein